MPSSLLKDKSRLLPLLWKELLQKIDNEWPVKYKKFGINRQRLQHQRKFVEALLSDILHTAKSNDDQKGKALSENTLLKYLKNNQLPQRIKSDTALLLLNYLNYLSWQHFVTSHPPATLQEQGSNDDNRPPKRDGSGWMFWGP